jgi:hypothetical protein
LLVCEEEKGGEQEFKKKKNEEQEEQMTIISFSILLSFILACIDHPCALLCRSGNGPCMQWMQKFKELNLLSSLLNMHLIGLKYFKFDHIFKKFKELNHVPYRFEIF